MPKPVYIICAEGVTEDRRTNLVSLFNVLEKLTATVEPDGDNEEKVQRLPLLRFRALAVWMREESDPLDQEFEAKLQLIIPPDGEEITLPVRRRFKFKEGGHLQRISLTFEGGPPMKGPGTLRVLSLVRAVGSEEWLRQEYPIFVEFKEAKLQEEHAEATETGQEKDASDGLRDNAGPTA